MQKSPGTTARKPNWDPLVHAATILLIFYVMVRSTFHASLRLLWYDELCTWIVASLPGAASIWNALLRAADSQAPGFYLLESWVAKIIPNQQIAFRLPSILAVGATLGCVYVWMKRRYSPTVSLISILVLLLTVLNSTYAVEARAYALVVACLAIALLFYDRAPSPVSCLGLATSLALAECFHYYAIPAMLPFAAAEAAYVWKRRVVRWQVWCALACGPIALLCFWPFLTSLKTYYGQNFWATSTVTVAIGEFGWLLGMPLDVTRTPATTAVALALSLAALSATFYLFIQGLRRSGKNGRIPDELLIATFLSLPFVCLGATKVMHAGFTERYALPVVLGVAFALGYALSRASRRLVLLTAVLVAFCYASQEYSFWTSYNLVRTLHGLGQKPIESLVRASGHPDLPVMVTGGNDFLQLVYYADPIWKPRFVAVVDPEANVKYGQPNTGDKQLLVLREVMPLNVIDYADFRKKQDRFLVCSIPFQVPWNNDPDWWILKLQDDGYAVTKLRTDGRHSIYLAEVKLQSDK
jgi:hypothetical protein